MGLIDHLPIYLHKSRNIISELHEIDLTKPKLLNKTNSGKFRLTKYTT